MLDRTWHYRGEGGANLVISIDDDLHSRIVARFSKSKYPDKDNDSKICEIAFYANSVMRPALGSHYVRPVSVGIVSEVDFERVKLEAQPFRPVQRCKKDIRSRKVIISADCVYLTPEYSRNTHGSTLCVEIKPKQGWHSEKMASCAGNLCHRCLKQYAKLYQGEIDTISRYCPLDLFSGDLERMKRAIYDLMDSPHNRFKLFKEGQLLYTEHVGCKGEAEQVLNEWFEQDNGLDHLAALVCTALLGDLSNKTDSSSSSLVVKKELIDLVPSGSKFKFSQSCDTRCQPLPKGCILQNVLDLQKHTNISDHGAKVLCENLLNNIDDLEGLHQLILWHPLTSKDANNYRRLLEARGLGQTDIEGLHQLQRFLLSVTAKDVSLLLTFREIADPDQENVLKLPSIKMRGGEKMFRVMVSVIDLDPKPVHRIANWVQRKEEWLKIYFDSIED